MEPTKFEEIAQFKEKMPKCSCGSGEEVMYIDMPESKCPIYEALEDKYDIKRLFCGECMSEDVHNHFPIKIMKVAKDIAERWRNIYIKVNAKQKKSNEQWQNLLPLVTFLDDIAKEKEIEVKVKISDEHYQLEELVGYIKSLMSEGDKSINKLITEYMILDLLNKEI